ncbi:uncharacterized protein LOC136084688 [Hydra vulgaris]|uniref:uncharacterized protein LOC136084688 n=1 Tax=Hydra vulgaris TaxID=6087 RepID=UPI0032E9F787
MKESVDLNESVVSEDESGQGLSNIEKNDVKDDESVSVCVIGMKESVDLNESVVSEDESGQGLSNIEKNDVKDDESVSVCVTDMSEENGENAIMRTSLLERQVLHTKKLNNPKFPVFIQKIIPARKPEENMYIKNQSEMLIEILKDSSSKSMKGNKTDINFK